MGLKKKFNRISTLTENKYIFESGYTGNTIGNWQSTLTGKKKVWMFLNYRYAVTPALSPPPPPIPLLSGHLDIKDAQCA